MKSEKWKNKKWKLRSNAIEVKTNIRYWAVL